MSDAVDRRRCNSFSTFSREHNSGGSSVFSSSTQTIQPRNVVDHDTSPILLYPTVIATKQQHTIRRQLTKKPKKVTFADAMDQLKCLAIREDDAGVCGSDAPASSEETDIVLPPPPPPPPITIAGRNGYEWRKPSSVDSVTPLLDNGRRQTFGGCDGSERLHCYTDHHTRFDTIPGRASAFSSRGDRRRSSMSVVKKVSPPVVDFCTTSLPSFPQQQRHHTLGCSSPLTYPAGAPSSFSGTESDPTRFYNTSGGCMLGGDDYDCDYVDMSGGMANSMTRLEELNTKMEHLISSIDEQKKRIDTIHRLFEQKENPPVESNSDYTKVNSGEHDNTYRSLADDDLYYGKAPLTDVQQAILPKKEIRKVKRGGSLFSCVQ